MKNNTLEDILKDAGEQFGNNEDGYLDEGIIQSDFEEWLSKALQQVREKTAKEVAEKVCEADPKHWIIDEGFLLDTEDLHDFNLKLSKD